MSARRIPALLRRGGRSPVVSGGAPSYDPLTALPELRVALDAATVTLVGSNVDVWPDLSGLAHNFSAPSSGVRPLYSATGFNGGSEPYVVSDGVDDTLRCAAVDLNPSGSTVAVYTAILVAKTVSIVHADFEVTLGGASVRPWVQQLVGPPRYAVENRPGSVLTIAANTNPRCHFFGLNGTKTWSQIGADAEASIAHASHSFADGGAMALFARTDSGAAAAAVQVAAFYLCADELTTDERAAFYAYATARWGV